MIFMQELNEPDDSNLKNEEIYASTSIWTAFINRRIFD